MSGRAIPDATVARLPVYHRVLVSLADSGSHTVSSEELATACGVTSAKLRKDLSYLGSYGTRGVGYDVQFLTYQIVAQLIVQRVHEVEWHEVDELPGSHRGDGGFGSSGR